MEQEMKYAVPSKEVQDLIWESELVKEYGDESTKEELVMKAIYFDTEELDLAKNNMTIRVRSEGGQNFATLKWGGCSTNGFHERNEVNIPVDNDSFIAPSAEMFEGSEDGSKLLEILGSKKLFNLLEMRYLRRKIRLKHKESLIELALDYGDIITDKGNVPILELELELLYGNIDNLKELGNEFISTYNLSPEDTSKFGRGIAVLK